MNFHSFADTIMQKKQGCGKAKQYKTHDEHDRFLIFAPCQGYMSSYNI